jgi:hypothetical protein
MAIKNVLLALLAIGSGLTNGLAFEAPTATAFQQGWQFNGLGWTPAPTSPPEAPHQILKRGLLEGRQLASTVLVGADQTCGYLSGRAGKNLLHCLFKSKRTNALVVLHVLSF